MAFSLAQQKAVAIVPKFTSILSLIGSIYIVQHVLKSRQRRALPYHRLLLALSVVDIIGSMVFFTGTWATPKGTKNVYAAVGTTQTCTAQGFFNQFHSIAFPFYNVSLAVYYLLVIRSGWREARISQLEPLLHGVPLFFATGTAIAGLPLDLYNNAVWVCWIAGYPFKCKDSARYGDAGTCTRGDNAWIYRWAFVHGPLWGAILFITVAMFLVYWHVLKNEKKTEKYIRGRQEQEQENSRRQSRRMSINTRTRKQSRKVANQAMLYVSAFYLTYTFPTLTRVLQLITGKVYFFTIIMMTVFLPLQGFWNLMIYLRPRWLRYREKNLGLSFCQLVTQFAMEVFSKATARRSSSTNLFDEDYPSAGPDSTARGSASQKMESKGANSGVDST